MRNNHFVQKNRDYSQFNGNILGIHLLKKPNVCKLFVFVLCFINAYTYAQTAQSLIKADPTKVKSSVEPDNNQKSGIQTALKKAQSNFFIENKGQLTFNNGTPANDVKFYGAYNGVKYYFGADFITYFWTTIESNTKNEKAKLLEKPRGHYAGISMDLEGANPNAIASKDGESHTTYYYGKNDIISKGYEKITFSNVYPFIDMKVYHLDNGQVKYDFIIHPGGNPNQIKMVFNGQDDINLLSDGSLSMKNRLGSLVESSPFAYQKDASKQVNCNFKATGNTVNFVVNNYDKNETLIIDPTRAWATFYGGNDHDDLYAVLLDDNNATGKDIIFAGGGTLSTSLPTNCTVAANACKAGSPAALIYDNYVADLDGFVIRFDDVKNGLNDMDWIVWFSGVGAESVKSLCLDISGTTHHLYAGGSTTSTDMATTTGAFITKRCWCSLVGNSCPPSHTLGEHDWFLAQIDASSTLTPATGFNWLTYVENSVSCANDDE